MKQIGRTSVAVILVAVAPWFAPSAAAQNQSPDELLTKARNTVSLSLMGPHHLEAEVTVRLTDGTKSKGSYSLDWAAPDRFREEIHLHGYDEIRVASGTTLYFKRNVDHIPLRIFQLEELMNSVGQVNQLQRDVAQHMKEANSNSHSTNQSAVPQAIAIPKRPGYGNVVCVSLAPTDPEVCVDTTLGWPVEIRQTNPELHDDAIYGKYQPLKKAYISRERRYMERGATIIEAEVEKLSSVRQFDASTLAPPAGAEQVPWCDDSVPAVRQPIKAPPSVSYEDFPEPEILCGLVGADGTLRRFSIIESGGPKADAAVRSIAESIHFAPATCGGKPIESETRFTISDLDFLSTAYSGIVPEAGAKGFTHPDCENCPTPPFSDVAFDHRIQGIVILSAIVAPDGRAHDIRIIRRLGYGLDESAVKSVRDIWRFKPATGPDGKPAAVHTLIEVQFNIY